MSQLSPLDMPSSPWPGHSSLQHNQETTTTRRRKLGVYSFYNPTEFKDSASYNKAAQITMFTGMSFDLQASNVKAQPSQSNSTIPEQPNLLTGSGTKGRNPPRSPSFPGMLCLTLIRRFSHSTLSHNQNDRSASSTGHLSIPRDKKCRSISLPILMCKSFTVNTKSIATFKESWQSGLESDNQSGLIIASDKKLSTASSSSWRYCGIRRSFYSLFFSQNTDQRQVNLPGQRRMRNTFFERRRNAICSELDNDVSLVTAKIKYQKIAGKRRNFNRFRFCRRWLCF